MVNLVVSTLQRIACCDGIPASSDRRALRGCEVPALSKRGLLRDSQWDTGLWQGHCRESHINSLQTSIWSRPCFMADAHKAWHCSLWTAFHHVCSCGRASASKRFSQCTPDTEESACRVVYTSLWYMQPQLHLPFVVPAKERHLLAAKQALCNLQSCP